MSRNINTIHRSRMNGHEKLARWVTECIGSVYFFIFLAVWTGGWLGWNVLAQYMHWPLVFDHPWGFAVWLFLSNLIQLHLMPLIMVGQTLQNRHSEFRADKEYEVTQKTEQEMQEALELLKEIRQLLQTQGEIKSEERDQPDQG